MEVKTSKRISKPQTCLEAPAPREKGKCRNNHSIVSKAPDPAFNWYFPKLIVKAAVCCLVRGEFREYAERIPRVVCFPRVNSM